MRQLYYTVQILLRGRGSNFIKLVSLTLGLLIGILLFSQIVYELSYENFYKDPENVALMRCRRAYRTIFLRRRYRKHGKKKSISWAGCRRTLPRMCPAMCRNTLTKSVLNLSFLVTKAISKYSSTISRMAAFTTMLSGRTKQNEKARHFYE